MNTTHEKRLQSDSYTVGRGTFWSLLLAECVVVLLLIHTPMKLFLAMAALAVTFVIISRPVIGLYLTTAIAYSGVASSLLQGLLLPVIAITALSALLLFLHRRDVGLPKSDQNMIFLLFGTLMLFSFTYASNINIAFESLYQFSKYFVLYLLIITLVETRKSLRGLLWVLVITGILMFLYGFYASILAATEETNARMISFIEDPNSYAIKLIPVVAFSYCLLRSERSRFPRLLSALIMLGAVGAIVLSFSRGGWLGLLAAFTIIGLKELKNRRVLVMTVLAVSLFLVIVPKDIFFTRFSDIREITMDRSVVQRLKVLKGGIQMFMDHPLLGVGIGNFIVHSKDYSNTNMALVAHNSYLHVAAELGIFGLLIFLRLLQKTGKSLFLTSKSFLARSQPALSFYAYGSLAALSGYMVTAFFLSEHLNAALFIIVGISVVLTQLHIDTVPEAGA